MLKGAYFNAARTLRWYLYRIWDESKPFVMFIGLNPSSADENENDNTITRVISMAKHHGYGGVYMVNCFPHISTESAFLITDPKTSAFNAYIITQISQKCKDVVLAWGSANRIVNDTDRIKHFRVQFPKARVIWLNKDGNPKHPLYCRIESRLIPLDKYDEYHLMNYPDFAPNCGKDWCVTGGGPTRWDPKHNQFKCFCGWQSKYDRDLIIRYKTKWHIQ